MTISNSQRTGPKSPRTDSRSILTGAMLCSGIVCSGIVCSGMVASGARAAEWQNEFGIAVGGYYSDNICLDSAGEQSGGAATVTPDVTINGHGKRANLSLLAALEYDSMADSNVDCQGGQGGQFSNRQALIPSLRFAGDLKLIEQWLTLDSDAFIGRNPIDPFAPGGVDSLNNRDNTNITYQYGAGATLQRRLLDNTDLRLRYHYDEQYNEASLVGDSNENRVEFDLGTDPASSRISTGIGGRYSKVEFAENEVGPAFDNTLSSAYIKAALRLNSSWQINGLMGEEWNEMTSADDDIDGSYWDAGLRWTPNSRVDIGIGTGERFFGTTPRLDARYHHKRTEITASYARTLTFPRNLRSAGGVAGDPFNPDFGAGFDPGFDSNDGQFPGGPTTVSGDPTFIGNTPIIDERLSVTYRFSARRTTITATVSDSTQMRTEDGSEADFSDVRVTFSRSLSSQLTGHLSAGWREREGQGGTFATPGTGGTFGEQSQAWRAGAGFSRRLGTHTTVSFGYQFTRQESDVIANEYDENRVTLSIRHTF